MTTDPRRQTSPIYTVSLPWLSPPLSLNDRDHWRTHHRKLQRAKSDVVWALRATSPRLPAMPGAAVFLNWRVPNWQRRDLDNMSASLKPATDALVAEGLIPDDDWRHVVFSGQRIHPPMPGIATSMWLTVQERQPHQRDGGG